MVAAIRVPAFVLTDKVEVPAFLLLCSYCKPRITQKVVPKMKAHSSGSFLDWTWMVLNCWLDWKRAAHIVLYYAKTIIKTLGCLLRLNWFCNLSFSPQKAYFMYCLFFSVNSLTLEPFPPPSSWWTLCWKGIRSENLLSNPGGYGKVLLPISSWLSFSHDFSLAHGISFAVERKQTITFSVCDL